MQTVLLARYFFAPTGAHQGVKILCVDHPPLMRRSPPHNVRRSPPPPLNVRRSPPLNVILFKERGKEWAKDYSGGLTKGPKEGA